MLHTDWQMRDISDGNVVHGRVCVCVCVCVCGAWVCVGVTDVAF